MWLEYKDGEEKSGQKGRQRDKPCKVIQTVVRTVNNKGYFNLRIFRKFVQEDETTKISWKEQ